MVFAPGPLLDYRALGRGDMEKARIFNESLRQQGILKTDAKVYTSLALTEADLQRTADAFRQAAAAVAQAQAA